jgi:hypothetical protein
MIWLVDIGFLNKLHVAQAPLCVTSADVDLHQH